MAPQLNEAACSIISGALFASAWWWFADGALTAASHDMDFGFIMWLPGLFVTLGMLGTTMLHPSDIKEDGDDVNKAKTLFFIAWLFIFGGLVGAVWICIQDFSGSSTTRSTTYPGVAIILQSVIITLSTGVLWVGRGASDDGMGFG